MKNYIVGRETMAFLAQASQWGTAVEGSTGLLFQEAAINWNQELAPLELNDSWWQQELEEKNITCSLELTQPFMFNHLEPLSLGLGLTGYDSPVEQTEAEGDYLHVVRPGSDLQGLFATVAMKRASAIYNVFPSCAVSGFELSGVTDPNHLTIKYFLAADTVVNGLDGISASAFDSLTYNDEQRAYFRKCRFYLADQSAGDLTQSDEITNLVSSFSFSFKRNFTTDYTNSSGLRMEEPVEDGPPEIIIKLSLIYKNQQGSDLFNDRLTGAAKKLRIENIGAPLFSDAGYAGADASFIIDFPHVRIEKDTFTDYSGLGRQGLDVTFRCLAPAGSGVAGMPFSEPFQFSIVNQHAARVIS